VPLAIDRIAQPGRTDDCRRSLDVYRYGCDWLRVSAYEGAFCFAAITATRADSSVTSQTILPSVIDYYRDLLPNVIPKSRTTTSVHYLHSMHLSLP
jgi:hypothetical protein